MRCTQLMGLPPAAKAYLEEYREWADTLCPHCARVIDREMVPAKVYKSARSTGMFDDGPELVEYKLRGGLTAREEVQYVEWSSGPMIYLRLVVSNGRVFEHARSNQS